MSEQVVTGSLYHVNVEETGIYAFVYLKKNVYGDGFIVDKTIDPNNIKTKINGKVVTCVGQFTVTFSGMSGSHDIFLYDNRLITSLAKKSELFCSPIE